MPNDRDTEDRDTEDREALQILEGVLNLLAGGRTSLLIGETRHNGVPTERFRKRVPLLDLPNATLTAVRDCALSANDPDEIVIRILRPVKE